MFLVYCLSVCHLCCLPLQKMMNKELNNKKRFTSQPRVHKWAGSTTGWVMLWNGDSYADTWCPAMEPMAQIMFFDHLVPLRKIYKSGKGPQVGLFHNRKGPVVKRVQWCGHLVSSDETNFSDHVL